MQNKAYKLLLVAEIALASLIAAYFIFYFWDEPIDDSFIPWRYARNLATGNGFVWNIGEGPVEGYTSFLWLIFLTSLFYFGLNPFFGVISVSVFSLAAVFYLTFRIAKKLSVVNARAGIIPALAVSLLIALPYSWMNAFDGLETIAASALYLTFIFFVLSYEESKRNSQLYALAILAFLCGLMRPELLLLCSSSLLLMLIYNPGYRWRIIKSVLLLSFLPGLAYMAWRYHEFGLLFPLPFYVKIGNVTQERRAEFAVSYVYAFCFEFSPWIIGAFLAHLAQDATHRKIIWYLKAPIIATMLLLLCVYPQMGMAYRFFMPIFPMLAILAAYGYIKALTTLWQRFQFPNIAIYPTILLLFVMLITPSFHYAWRYLRISNIIEKAHLPCYGVEIGQYLRKISEPGEKPVLVSGDAGVMPYYSGWNHVDLFGLNDKHIATTEVLDAEYVFRKNPDLIILTAYKRESFKSCFWDWGNEIYQMALRRGMRPVKIINVGTTRDPLYYWFLAYPGSKIAKKIKKMQMEKCTVEF